MKEKKENRIKIFFFNSYGYKQERLSQDYMLFF